MIIFTQINSSKILEQYHMLSSFKFQQSYFFLLSDSVMFSTQITIGVIAIYIYTGFCSIGQDASFFSIGSDASFEVQGEDSTSSQNYFLFKIISVIEQNNEPSIKKAISTITKIALLAFDPNPIMAVSSESIMNAQITAPPLRIPVTWAYPIGKATQQPIQYVIGTTGTTNNPITPKIIMVIPAFGRVNSCNSIRTSPPEAEKVRTFINKPQFFVFFINTELRTAPTAPSTIKATAPRDIAKSLNPKGLIRKLALAAKIKNVPQKKEQEPKNFHRFLSFFILVKIYLIVSSCFVLIFEGGTQGRDFIKIQFPASIIKVMIAQPRYKEKIYLLASSPSLSSFTTNVGIANPTPDPIILVPTIMEVANALYILHALRSKGKTNKKLSQLEYLQQKAGPSQKINIPQSQKENLH